MGHITHTQKVGHSHKFSGRTIVHDYQLTTIGSALNAFGYSFNSVDEKELADAEKLLIDVKPHLFAITSDYQPGMRNGDAWLTICWSGDGKQRSQFHLLLPGGQPSVQKMRQPAKYHLLMLLQ